MVIQTTVLHIPYSFVSRLVEKIWSKTTNEQFNGIKQVRPSWKTWGSMAKPWWQCDCAERLVGFLVHWLATVRTDWKIRWTRGMIHQGTARVCMLYAGVSNWQPTGRMPSPPWFHKRKKSWNASIHHMMQWSLSPVLYSIYTKSWSCQYRKTSCVGIRHYFFSCWESKFLSTVKKKKNGCIPLQTHPCHFLSHNMEMLCFVFSQGLFFCSSDFLGSSEISWWCQSN